MGEGSGGSTGIGGGAKLGTMVSSSSSCSPLVSRCMACVDTSLSLDEATSGCSLPSSLVSSVVELRRSLLGALVGAGLPDASIPLVVSLDLAVGGAKDGLEAL